MRLVTAAILYFAIVFAVGFVLGPIRVLWLEAWIGKTLAVLRELPVLLEAMILAARWIPRRLGVGGSLRALASLASMGLGALVLEQLADLTVGLALRNITAADQLAHLETPAGLIYAASLVAFAAMPALVNFRRETA